MLKKKKGAHTPIALIVGLREAFNADFLESTVKSSDQHKRSLMRSDLTGDANINDARISNCAQRRLALSSRNVNATGRARQKSDADVKGIF